MPTMLSLGAWLRPVVAALCVLLAASVSAQQPDPELEQIRDKLARNLPDVQRQNIVRSPAPGLFEIHQAHAFGYVTADGRYLVSGDLIDMQSGARLTDQRRNQERLQSVLDQAGNAIVFAPPPGQARQWVTIFTDVDCHYCKLLHKEIDAINDAGIGVRYLFFSKDGKPSQAFDEAQKVWCDVDRQGVLSTALLTGKLPRRAAGGCPNPIESQYELAKAMGLRGTPATILPDGSVLYGFVKARDFVTQVDQHPAR